ncbi:DNA helicase [Tanacetum coccineum]
MNQNRTVFDIDEETDAFYLQKAVEYHEWLIQQEAQPRLTRTPIFRDREDAERRLRADYFDDHDQNKSVVDWKTLYSNPCQGHCKHVDEKKGENSIKPTVSSEAIGEVVSDRLCREAPLSNSRFDSPFQGCESEDQSSGSSSLKCKSTIDTSCDAFSRYSQLCARNVSTRSSLNSPEAGKCSNFRVVQHFDFEVFGRYSELSQRDTRATTGTLSIDVGHTTNVRNSQTISDESLRLNPTEEVDDTSLPESTEIPFSEGDQNNTSSSTPFISEGSGCIDTLMATVTREDGEGCSFCRLEDCGHIGDCALTTRKRTQRHAASEESPSKRVRRSYAYTDLGDCDQQCHHYEATFWFREHLKGHSNYRRPEYHLCCRVVCHDSFGAKVDAFDQQRKRSGFVSGQKLPPLARDKCREIDIPEFKIRLYNAEGARGYELPTSNTLGAIVFYSGVTGSTDFDVIIQEKDGPAKRINKLHKSYMSLQFPLLFIYGQPGFHTELMLKPADDSGKERRVTMRAYYAYLLHPRQHRLDFICKKQSDIRSDYLSGLYDAISRGERDGFEVGGRIMLPMSFTEGPWYMYAHYLDALAIFQKLGNLQFFISFTCNVKWLEIRRYMVDYPELTNADRPDIVCQVFEQKIHDFLDFLKSQKTFRAVTGVLYTVEFQKPHCHTLLWVDSESKIQGHEDVNGLISAELPDLQTDPQGYKVVLEMMIHGPCGDVNMSATCMQRDKCTKNFPKKFTPKTFFDDEGHVHYQRKDTGVSTVKHQALWRILKFDIHCREPAVQILSVHLEGIQRVTFRDRDRLESVVTLPGQKNMTLTEWLAYNEANEDGRHLTDLDFPLEFVWYDNRKSWSPHQNSKSSIGRLAY